MTLNYFSLNNKYGCYLEFTCLIFSDKENLAMFFDPIKSNLFKVTNNHINFTSKNVEENHQTEKTTTESRSLVSPDDVLTHLDATSLNARPQVKKINLAKFNNLESFKRIEETIDIFDKMFQNNVEAVKAEGLNLSDAAIQRIALKMVS